MKVRTFPATDHDFDHNLIDEEALFVLRTLTDAGYTAYIVGGGVRDLLLKKSPKDFDISTSAKPEEIKKLFRRNCILIGRRFRLAHVTVGHKTYEVSTFRSGDNESELIVQDNQWGEAEQDAVRRDFTINGLFYDPVNNTIIDYVGGWEDLHNRVLRSIGDPSVRFIQDPVRMIRLIKFIARFGFSIDGKTKQALDGCKKEILKSSPARVLEELFRMLESGASEPFFRLMTQSGLLSLLFPQLTNFLLAPHGEEIYRYLRAVDTIIKEGQKGTLDRSVLASCLIFPILEEELRRQYFSHNNTPHIGDILLLTSELIKAVINAPFPHFPRKISSAIGFILSAQYRMTPPGQKHHFKPKVARNKDFPLALAFLKLRAVVDSSYEESFTVWSHLYRTQIRHMERKAHAPPHHSNQPRRDDGSNKT